MSDAELVRVAMAAYKAQTGKDLPFVPLPLSFIVRRGLLGVIYDAKEAR